MNKMYDHIIHNGSLVSLDKGQVSIFSKGMFFNFAVYDSLKVVKGKPFFLGFHVERFIESAKMIGIEHSYNKEQIIEFIKLLIKKNNINNAMIRFLLQGAGSKHEQPELFLFPVGLTFYNDRDYRHGIKVITFEGERQFPQAKAKDLLLNFVALRKAMNEDAKDALLINPHGYILEGTRTNFFAIKNDTLYTAPLSHVLEGITRKIVVQLAKEQGVLIIEKMIHKDELNTYDEFFLTSTSMNVLPISNIANTIQREVGPVTKILIKAFREYYQREVFENGLCPKRR